MDSMIADRKGILVGGFRNREAALRFKNRIDANSGLWNLGNDATTRGPFDSPSRVYIEIRSGCFLYDHIATIAEEEGGKIVNEFPLGGGL
jgi:hypothetical protein